MACVSAVSAANSDEYKLKQKTAARERRAKRSAAAAEGDETAREALKR